MDAIVHSALSWVLVLFLCDVVRITSAQQAIELDGQQLACDSDKREAWQRIRVRLREKLPSFTGRIPFAIIQTDVDFFEHIHQDAMQLDAEDVLFTHNELKVPGVWSDCALGMLTLRIFGLLTQLSAKSGELSQAAAALAPVVSAAPWVEILLHGWPVFTAYALLARWASPHGDQNVEKDSMPEGSAAECDAHEAGAMSSTRHLVSDVWRSRDPLLVANDVVVVAELALAKVNKEAQGVAWGSSIGACHWTEHPGRYLGGLVDTAEEAGTDLLNSMKACSETPLCSGVTAAPHHGVPGDVQFTMRSGKPFLHESAIGETSYVKWCQTLAYSQAPACPFAESTGLLATAVRQLQSTMLTDFSPEFVIEAQAVLVEWTTHVGQEVARKEAWTTGWPIWDVLGKLQQRVDLSQSPASGSGYAQQVPWHTSLQRALAFDDESWRLTIEELEVIGSNSLQAEEGSEHMKGSVPMQMRQSIRCATGKQCVAEFFARMQLMLYSSETLPLRDPIFMTHEDVLAAHFMERGRALSHGSEDDWGSLTTKEASAASSTATLAEELDYVMPSAHPLQVDRFQLAYFIHEARKLLNDRPLGRCLEWDQPFLLVRGFQGVCRWSDVFSYSEPDPDVPMMGLPGRHEYTYGTRHYWGDLMSKDGMGIEPDTFDLIVCPFVFEHVAQPFIAMRNLAYVLRSGGFIIWAAPMFQHYHGSPHDYFRYTPKGARALATDAGLEVVWLYAPGNLSLVTGVMTGMLLPYWSKEQVLAEAPLVNDENSPRHPLNVFMLLRKPTLTSHSDETSQ